MPELTAITLPLHLVLTVTGFVLILLVSKIYKPFKTFQTDRTIMTPFLIVGIFVAFSGITELIEPYFGLGGVVHAIAMLLSAFFFTYGIYMYQKMLERQDALNYYKAIIKLMQENED